MRALEKEPGRRYASAEAFETVHVSAGKRGLQVQLSPSDLVRVTGALVAPIATS